MNKEEILEKSRKENKNRDVFELETTSYAGRIASIAGAVLCMVISVLDWQLTQTINWACWTVNFGMLSVLYVVKYIKLKRKQELIMTLLNTVCFAFFCYGYIYGLWGVR